MKNKKIIKYIIILVVINILFIIINSNISFCFDATEWKPNDLSGETNIVNKGNAIIGAVKAVGSIVSVIALIGLGIRYMVGSVEEKAQYKKTMIPYVVGAIMVFAISNILSILYNFVSTW